MTEFSISAPVAIFTGAALLLVWFIAKVMAALGRRRWLRRLHGRHNEIHAARARERITSSGPGIVVWARAEDAARSPQAIPHVEALYSKSGRLLATAEREGYAPQFVESLRRMHHHVAGLRHEVAPRRVR